jgi:broad specificity phosphatase PhoE
MARLHLIRHGRASALADDYDQLDPLGEIQAGLLGEHLARGGQRFDRVYVGPLRRQRETWRLMHATAARLGARWPEAVSLAGLAEAPLDLLMKKYLRARIPHDARLRSYAEAVRGAIGNTEALERTLGPLLEYMTELWRGKELAAGELESAAAFDARVLDTWNELRKHDEVGEIAVVTSNGVIAQLLRLATGTVEAWSLAKTRLYNTSVSLVDVHPDRVVLVAQNLIEHLPDPAQRTVL